ncbi:MAG: S-adenosylmethionine:tRNA ribosyltransferase-isomerase [Terrimonas sp.]|nr:S-adenosylmethionine:tRNA ribosyltransferase-isomerase [Terrimonas sp.]
MKPHPQHIRISDFSYSLPKEKIAEYPLEERDRSKLLICKKGNLSTSVYRDIADHLPENALLIFNDTKVVEARILFQKPTGGQVEIFCLEPDSRYGDISTALQQENQVSWKCLIGGASKWKPGQVLEKKIRVRERESILQAAYCEKSGDSFTLELRWDVPSTSFAEILHAAGAIPLPPYIKRAAESSDAERYQTIYARFNGSVAAPTAGLHFTRHVFETLERKNIRHDFVTLHVGAGTFKPVKSATMLEHEMHAEFIHIRLNSISNILDHPGKVIAAVGTTSYRTLESLYWLGVKTWLQPAIQPQDLWLSQWEAYALEEKRVPVPDALGSLLRWMRDHDLQELITKTQLIAAPGYRTKIVNILITNFHQPQSTLLLLVAALIGDTWKTVYQYALENDFRFLSYGDGNLIWVD